jgi:choline dehydrogenase
MLAKIAFEDPQTCGNPRDLTVDSYKKIYQRTFDLGRR